MTLQEILQAIDQLSADELEQVRARIATRQQQSKVSGDDALQWITKLDQAVAAFWEGLAEDEWAEIVEAMNAEYTDRKDLHIFDWLDELPENQR